MLEAGRSGIRKNSEFPRRGLNSCESSYWQNEVPRSASRLLK